MKRNWKRILALLLTAAMVFTMNTSVFATVPGEGDTTPEPPAVEAEATTPEATTPEATTPEATTPEATTPEVTTPEVTTPEVTTPEVTDPETTNPDGNDDEAKKAEAAKAAVQEKLEKVKAYESGEENSNIEITDEEFALLGDDAEQAKADYAAYQEKVKAWKDSQKETEPYYVYYTETEVEEEGETKTVKTYYEDENGEKLLTFEGKDDGSEAAYEAFKADKDGKETEDGKIIKVELVKIELAASIDVANEIHLDDFGWGVQFGGMDVGTISENTDWSAGHFQVAHTDGVVHLATDLDASDGGFTLVASSNDAQPITLDFDKPSYDGTVTIDAITNNLTNGKAVSVNIGAAADATVAFANGQVAVKRAFSDGSYSDVTGTTSVDEHGDIYYVAKKADYGFSGGYTVSPDSYEKSSVSHNVFALDAYVVAAVSSDEVSKFDAKKITVGPRADTEKFYYPIVLMGNGSTVESMYRVSINQLPKPTAGDKGVSVNYASDGKGIEVTVPAATATAMYQVALSSNTGDAAGINVEALTGPGQGFVSDKILSSKDAVAAFTGLDPSKQYEVVIRRVYANSYSNSSGFSSKSGEKTVYIPSAWVATDCFAESLDVEEAEKVLSALTSFKNVGLNTASINIAGYATDAAHPIGYVGKYSVSALSLVPKTNEKDETTRPSGDKPSGYISVNEADPESPTDWIEADSLDGGALLSANVLPKAGSYYDVYAQVYLKADNADMPKQQNHYVWAKIGTFGTVASYQIINLYYEDDDVKEIPFYSKETVASYFTQPYLVLTSANGAMYSNVLGSHMELVPSLKKQYQNVGVWSDYFIASGGGFETVVVSANNGEAKNLNAVPSKMYGDGDTNLAKARAMIDDTHAYTARFRENDWDEYITASQSFKLVNSKLYITASDNTIDTQDSRKIAKYDLVGPSAVFEYGVDASEVDVANLPAGATATAAALGAGFTGRFKLEKEDSLAAFTVTPPGSALSTNVAYDSGSHKIVLSDLSSISADSAWLIEADAIPGLELVALKTEAAFNVQNAKDELALTITMPEKVMFGQKGGKAYDDKEEVLKALNELFKPVVSVSGSELEGTNGYHITYRFTLKESELDGVSSNTTYKDQSMTSFNAIAGSLEDVAFKPGKTVYVVAMAQRGAKDLVAFAKGEFTMAKRDVKLVLPKENALSVDRNAEVVVSTNKAADIDAINANIKALDYAGAEIGTDAVFAYPNVLANIQAKDAKVTMGVSKNTYVVLDGSKVNTSIPDDYPTTIYDYTLYTPFADYFEVTKSLAYATVVQASYVTVTASFGGEISVNKAVYKNKTLPATAGATSLASYFSKDFNKWLTDTNVNVEGFKVEATDIATGQVINVGTIQYDKEVEARNSLDKVFALVKAQPLKDLNGENTGYNYDFTFTAIIKAKLNDDGIVSVITVGNVNYDGRSHILGVEKPLDEKQAKSKVRDLNLTLQGKWVTDDGVWDSADELKLGEDYKVSYKNNKEANVYFDAEGKLQTRKGFEKKKPTLVVTGINSYKGMKLTLHFNILPKNLAGAEPSVTGFTNSYVTGKKPIKLKYKVKYENEDTDKTVTLKKGKDFEELVYFFNSDDRYWTAGATPQAAGNYALTLVGTGNFYGEFGKAFEVNTAGIDQGGYQFVVADKNMLLSNAKVTVKPNKIDYSALGAKGLDNKKYSAYVTAVRLKGSKTDLSKDYWTVRALDKDEEVVDNDIITDAGVYYLEVLAKADDKGKWTAYGAKKVKFTVKGKKLTKKMFTLTDISAKKSAIKGTTIDYNEFNATTLKLSGLTYGKDYEINNKTYDRGFGAGDVDGTIILTQAPGKYDLYLDGLGQYGGSTLKMTITRKGITFKKAVESGAISFTASDVELNATGAYPKLAVSFNKKAANQDDTFYIDKDEELKATDTIITKGYTDNVTYSQKPEDGTNGFTAKITVKNNKKAGTGKIVISAVKDGGFTGSYTVPFNIKVGKIGAVGDFAATQSDIAAKVGAERTAAIAATKSNFYFLADDQLASKKVKVSGKLYQFDQFGLGTYAEVKKSDYTATAVAKTGDAVQYNVTISGKGKNYETATKKDIENAATFDVYAKKATFPTLFSGGIKTLVYQLPGKDGETYDATSTKNTGTLDSKGVAFTGGPIYPVVTEITLKDGTTLTSKGKDFDVAYGVNTAVGDGTIIIKLKRGGSVTGKDYKVGGTYTYKFKITAPKLNKVEL